MRKGQAESTGNVLIVMVGLLIAGAILTLLIFGQPEGLMEHFSFEKNIEVDPETCIKPPNIEVEYRLDGDDVIIDASATRSGCLEQVNFIWQIFDTNYTEGDDICLEDDCSQISCCDIGGEDYFNEDIYLYAEGDLSFLTAKKLINVGDTLER